MLSAEKRGLGRVVPTVLLPALLFASHATVVQAAAADPVKAQAVAAAPADGTTAAAASPTAAAFPRPAELEPDVRFWIRVYTEVTTQGGLIHDDRYLGIVYERIDFPPGIEGESRKALVDAAREKYQRILRRLANGDRSGLDAEEQRVLALWPANVSDETLTSAADRVRFQLGQADRFREGLVRSGAWEHHVVETLQRQGLPAELAALPHVESSFNPRAYSKVGAAGMWQFMPSTGRRWLRVDNVVDERLDPYKSTVAAAQFLSLNYSILGTWPLALTAYNHGAGGLRRAKDMMGTDDIVSIVRYYQSPSFGFASRNFYVSFLAALDVDRNYQKYFGPLERKPRDDSRTVILGDYVPAASIARVFGVDQTALRDLNLALLDPIWDGSRFVPQGYELRVPLAAPASEAAFARLTDAERYAQQKRDAFHKVKRGETLSLIAERYDTTVDWLVQANGLRSRSVRAGQALRLPGTIQARASTPAAAAAREPTSGAIYIVKRGESLSAIAQRVGLSESELMALNSLKNPNFVYEGQRLRTAKAVAAVAPVTAPTVAVKAAPKAPRLAAAEPALPGDEPEEVTGSALAREQVRAQKAEPVSGDQEADLGPGLVPGVQSAASADSWDYSVAANGTILIAGAETLGHIADWLGVSAARLRTLNSLKSGAPIAIGRRLQLDLTQVDAATFEQRRTAYHRALQQDFFTRYRITGSDRHRVVAGESLWTLTQQNMVPIWLLQQYNPTLDVAKVRQGTILIIPRVVAVDAGPAAAP